MRKEDVQLSTSVTVARYRELEAASDRKALAVFVRERFEERYFCPVVDSPSKHGFAILAVACLAIETLESFYQGLGDTKGKSKDMFHDFFERDTDLRIFSSNDDWFYRHIRCGILHQSETRDGWRISRKGSLLDMPTKTINATKFLSALREAVAAYSVQVATDEISWENFKKKMNTICDNCF